MNRGSQIMRTAVLCILHKIIYINCLFGKFDDFSIDFY